LALRPVSQGRRPKAALALLSFAMMIVSLDQYIVVVALPDIGRDLGYSPHTLQLVVSAYAMHQAASCYSVDVRPICLAAAASCSSGCLSMLSRRRT
jgi:MFS family permease